MTRTIASAAESADLSAAGMPLSRRRLLAGLATGMAAGGAAALAAGGPAARAADPPPRSKIIGFTKPFQSAGPTETADIVAQIGWDGVEFPVRPKGQVDPEKVEEDLPRYVETLAKAGREITVLCTAIKAPDPLAEKVLRTAARLGIRRYRLGFWLYAPDRPIPEQIAEIRAVTRDLAALNAELGICGAHQNHSGSNYFGAPIWDIYEAVRDCDRDHMGICFDIGHATIEGGLSWPIEARLMRPSYTAVFLKDFLWKKGDKGWKSEWCPLGEGMVDRRFFTTLAASGYTGPISQHHEYELGPQSEMIAAMKKDREVLAEWLAG
jgi:sugar phosphate isomerase/epimerase